MEVIAELGINHNGDLDIAKKMIDVAYSAGCDYVKFQKRDVETVYSKEELDKPRESPWGTTTREQKFGIEFDFEDYIEIEDYCEDKIKWFVSPWDIGSFDMMTAFEHPFIKVPSALMTNIQLLEAFNESREKVILSTGMCTLDEVDKAIEIIREEMK